MVRSSCLLSADNIEDMETFEDMLSTHVQDTYNDSIDNERMGKMELAERLGIQVAELKPIEDTALWSFKRSIQMALAMGLNVSIKVSNIE